MTVRIIEADVMDGLAQLEDGSVHCVVTSPPYWGLRDYGTATWTGGDPDCKHRVREDARVESSALGGGKGTTGHQREGFKAECPRCGAIRQDKQIGLEPTPEMYVEHIVAVFREVRRVLRDDGTLWLNLGDCYHNGDKGGYAKDRVKAEDSLQRSNLGANFIGAPNRQPHPTLKPKDLVGIPWLIAKALQAPYYTGTIRDERDRIWLAAMLDAEGCMFIQKRKTGQHNGQGYYRKNDNYGPGVEIANTSLAVVERIRALVGKGSICTQGPDETGGRRKQTIYRWNLRTAESRDFVRELYPHLVAKQQQARILLGCPSSGEQAAAAHAGLIALHRTGLSDVDFPPPSSMFEPGWYLRSDVIWSKANPMPESVRDRPTRSHEYVFLLSKRAKYYYDAAAIREPRKNLDAPEKMPDGWDTGEGAHGSFHRNGREKGKTDKQRGHGRRHAGFNDRWDGMTKAEQQAMGANKRTVWPIATQPFPGAHFATFPEALVKPCILAGSREGDTILDPFAGSGTVGIVAQKAGRSAILIDVNPSYCEMMRERLAQGALL